MKKFIIPLCLVSLFLCSNRLYSAGGDEKAMTSAVYMETGNTMKLISVPINTNTVVLISSAPADANLGINEWRERFIINLSTIANLVIYPNNKEYSLATATSTYSVFTLSSCTAANIGVPTASNSLKITYQGAVYGIWVGADHSDPSILGTKGLGGYATYYKK